MAGILIGDRAVVIGAGMGGLVAARALADSFREVLVFERDDLPLAAEHRTGTPQSRHVHALLAGGQHALDELFPGFEEELAQAGAVPMRVGLDARIEMPGYDPFPQRDLGWHVYSMSRPLIELTVRRVLHRRTNIAIRPRCRVLQVTAASDGAAATGIRWAGSSGNSETIVADLIVDASGRGRPTLALLDVIGRERPKETAIGVDIDHPDVKPLIPNPLEAGLAALKRNGHYPINHTVVVKDELLAAHSGLAADVFNAFAESKRRYIEKHYPALYDRMRGVASAFGKRLDDDALNFSGLGFAPLGAGCSVVHFPPTLTRR